MQGGKPGLAIGLYRDFAVGANPHGAEAWADNELVVSGASIGAPPDPLSRSGQNWGLAPLNPLALRRRGFAPLIAALRANMRHAGILRIDHVMGLRRLYWVPSGSPATSGAYVEYPFEAVLRLLALESRRHRCAVIGEDLGTVPDGFRETMRAANVLSYRVLAFERHGDGSFMRPDEYPPLAAASAATHDLATVKGFWLGARHRVAPAARALSRRGGRNGRGRGARAATGGCCSKPWPREGLLARERFGAYLSADGEPVYDGGLGEAILVYLARSRARLTLVQIEDVAGEMRAGEPARHDRFPSELAPPAACAARGAARRAGDGADCCARRGSAPSVGRRKADPAMSEAGTEAVAIRATYRLQFHKGFTFRDAEALVPYLARLGVSHLYASPLMQARPGSTHGYDIVDHNRLNPEIGTEEEFEALVASLAAHGMGLIVDIVPNHMGVGGADNSWWLDVLEWGENSPYAPFFDINWDPIRDDLKGRVLLPVLGDQYGAVLESGRDRAALRSRQRAISAPGITSIAFRSRRCRTPTSCATAARR